MLKPARITLGAIAAALLAAFPAAWASPFTLNFQGTVTQAVFDPFDPLGGAVGAGTAMYSYLNFDSDAVDTAPDANLGSYTLSGGTYGFAGVFGNVVFPLLTSATISVVDGLGGGPDLYTVFASEGTPGGLNDYFSFSMMLQDDSGTAISSDALPTGMPDLSRFALRTFAYDGQYTNVDGQFIQFEVLGNVAAIPAPGTASLVLAGLAAAALQRRRRRA